MNQPSDQPIMIIEDSDDDYETTVRALTQDGRLNSTLLRFEYGEAALRYLTGDGLKAGVQENVRPRIILLDLNLPGMRGDFTLEMIKSKPELVEIPIVVLTTSNDPGDIYRCYRAGANTYIQKPVDCTRYFAVLRQLRDYWLDLAILPGVTA